MSVIPGAALLPVASTVRAEIGSASPAPMISRLVAPSPIAPDSLVTMTATEQSVTGLCVGQVNATSLATMGSEPITLTVAPAGTFTVTVVSSPISLTVSASTATGTLQGVTLTDTRNYYPGWSVTGQAADFTASGAPAISGIQLGWTPDAEGSLQGGAILGGSVAPAAYPGARDGAPPLYRHADDYLRRVLARADHWVWTHNDLTMGRPAWPDEIPGSGACGDLGSAGWPWPQLDRSQDGSDGVAILAAGRHQVAQLRQR
jgi:hypothetical protein